jgi:UTP--glucose-1-phosphate uridylyltransferase
MTSVSESVQAAADRMKRDGLPASVVHNFERLFSEVLRGETGIITEQEIEPVTTVETLAEVSACDETVRIGTEALNKLVVVRLNGGLGTTMGLERAKSLLTVRGTLSFNDIIGHQLREMGKRLGVAIPLVHMTSFSTDADVQAAMEPFADLRPASIPSTFLQHRHPKIYVDSMTPASESNDELNWNPPGHGDLYAALLATGLAEKLLALGKRYMFVANADNLGATVDPAILGYLVKSGAPFLMETAERTKADSKGGHLARRKSSGRLILRESGQAPTTATGEISPEFQDISRYRHFNTNNIWLDLQAVVDVAKVHDGTIPLPLISNRKTVNPRDRSSRAVVQIETAMGAAIEVFDGARALQVPRSRFAPVKSNNDLLVVRSDVYVLTPDYVLVVNPKRNLPGLPLVSLDTRYFGLLRDFEARVKVVPSLVNAESLVVKGDVVFSHPLTVCGRVTLTTSSETQRSLPAALSVAEAQEYSL